METINKNNSPYTEIYTWGYDIFGLHNENTNEDKSIKTSLYYLLNLKVNSFYRYKNVFYFFYKPKVFLNSRNLLLYVN